MKSMSSWLRKASVGAVTVAAVLVASLLAVAPAQAAPSPGKADASWATVAAAPGEAGTRAICSPPTRLTTQAIWYDCTVFSGQYIQAWIVCSGYIYFSDLIGEGSWYIVGTCPPGTLRDDEGIIYYE
ncbi:hypothetical protein [Actinophytocola oryzae]|uniref:Uncharacterized protein n=1 Tax=Actinophytocola oryzae TaxID=502181 RepID=A0A4V3FT27_9PSEU|nr:hypothetical protein [Actinophytocola oryzae]TDV49701.1 hypothetical protein CLV71_10740 [Actinophytocola oryzae]